MDDHEQVTEYSIQEVIDAATDFYTFLTHVHVPDATLLIPPSTGWPDIIAESHALFHKNDEVLELSISARRYTEISIFFSDLARSSSIVILTV